jgi:hypothetical protein
MNDIRMPQATASLCRLGMILLFAVWWPQVARLQADLASVECWNQNDECDRAFGENCVNCPADCACICGDDVCTAGESCAGCEEDCACLCGDSICSWPAEGGGAGTGVECDGEPGCELCTTDCGECLSGYCWPEVCSSTTQMCEACTSDDQCEAVVSAAWCSRIGQCTDYCWDNADCHLDDCCDGSGQCVPCPEALQARSLN